MRGVTQRGNTGNTKAKKLTALGIKAIKPGDTRMEKRVPDSKGLYLIVQPSGRKSFAVRFRVNGKLKKLTLPRGITLAAARVGAATAWEEVEKGNDPSAAKKQAKHAQKVAAANTFQAIAESYLEREGKKKDGKRLRSLEWRRTLLQRLVYPTLGDQPITMIRRKAIIELLDDIEDGKLSCPDKKTGKRKRIVGGAVMAHMTLAIIRRIMNWYAVRDEDYEVPIVRGMARIIPEEHARARVLKDDELRAVWKTAEQRPNDPFAALVKFMLLTAARRSEAAAMTWDEIIEDEEVGACWLLPAARNKVKVDLLRPLSKNAQDLLDARPRIEGCPYVFTYGAKPVASFSQLKGDFDDACGVSNYTLHDLRRSARTLMSKAGVISDHAEQCLGHLLPGVRKTYNRDDFKPQKKAAFDRLAAKIESIVHPPGGNVRSLDAARG
jgi:integrase